MADPTYEELKAARYCIVVTGATLSMCSHVVSQETQTIRSVLEDDKNFVDEEDKKDNEEYLAELEAAGDDLDCTFLPQKEALVRFVSTLTKGEYDLLKEIINGTVPTA